MQMMEPTTVTQLIITIAKAKVKVASWQVSSDDPETNIAVFWIVIICVSNLPRDTNANDGTHKSHPVDYYNRKSKGKGCFVTSSSCPTVTF